ncbi:MAG: redoxin domain-containing protein [Proteobacteria bacterium]|nr:redoxin domain-containing protein [Pseudomonadota bacterium]
MILESAVSAPLAPPLQISRWFNTPAPLDLMQLRGKVVVVHAFQMLCPGCVQHGLPQTQRLWQLFRRDDLMVIGLHSVFEHHAVMGPPALQTFIQEYRWDFPIGIDQPAAHNPVPLTMQAYGLQGTPSLVLLDRRGRIRLQHLGRIDDIMLGLAVGQLLAE